MRQPDFAAIGGGDGGPPQAQVMTFQKGVEHLLERQVLGAVEKVELGDGRLSCPHRWPWRGPFHRRLRAQFLGYCPAALLEGADNLAGISHHDEIERIPGFLLLLSARLGASTSIFWIVRHQSRRASVAAAGGEVESMARG